MHEEPYEASRVARDRPPDDDVDRVRVERAAGRADRREIEREPRRIPGRLAVAEQQERRGAASIEIPCVGVADEPRVTVERGNLGERLEAERAAAPERRRLALAAPLEALGIDIPVRSELLLVLGTRRDVDAEVGATGDEERFVELISITNAAGGELGFGSAGQCTLSELNTTVSSDPWLARKLSRRACAGRSTCLDDIRIVMPRL